MRQDEEELRKRLKNMKNLNQKKFIFRIIFYSLVFFVLLLIPIIYKLFFMTYEIEMLFFIFPPYVIGEIIGTSILVFLAEYYYFVKKQVEIKDKDLRKGISGVIIFLLIFFSKLFVLFLG